MLSARNSFIFLLRLLKMELEQQIFECGLALDSPSALMAGCFDFLPMYALHPDVIRHPDAPSLSSTVSTIPPLPIHNPSVLRAITSQRLLDLSIAIMHTGG